MQSFEAREYGRQELAQLYSPDILPESAWKKLKRWIEHYPGLTERLSAIGYNGNSHTFTPAQVRLIVEALGEP